MSPKLFVIVLSALLNVSLQSPPPPTIAAATVIRSAYPITASSAKNTYKAVPVAFKNYVAAPAAQGSYVAAPAPANTQLSKKAKRCCCCPCCCGCDCCGCGCGCCGCGCCGCCGCGCGCGCCPCCCKRRRRSAATADKDGKCSPVQSSTPGLRQKRETVIPEASEAENNTDEAQPADE